MRILSIVAHTRGGGSEHQAVRRYLQYGERGIEVELLVLGHEGPLSDVYRKAGINVRLWSRERASIFTRLSRKRFDVLETYGQRGHLIGRLMKMTVFRKGVLISLKTSNDAHWSHWRRVLERLSSRWTTAFVSNSVAGKRALLNCGVQPRAIHVIPNSIDLSCFPDAQGRRQARLKIRAELDLEESDFVLLNIANLRRAKAQHVAVEALGLLKATVPRAVLLLAGEGPAREPLQDMCRQLGLEERVRFLGWRDDVPELLGAADLFLLPSLREGMPNSVMEAMAAGTPVVASDVGGVGELIDHEVSGLRVQPDSSSELADAIRSLVESPEKLKALSQAAMDRARLFSPQRQLESWLNLYSELGLQRASPDSGQNSRLSERSA